MGRGPKYSEQEDYIILACMRGVNRKIHRDVLRRCYEIAEQHLPERTPEGIRERYYALIGKKPLFYFPIKDLKDILSPQQRSRIRLRIPTPQGMVRSVRDGKRVK